MRTHLGSHTLQTTVLFIPDCGERNEKQNSKQLQSFLLSYIENFELSAFNSYITLQRKIHIFCEKKIYARKQQLCKDLAWAVSRRILHSSLCMCALPQEQSEQAITYSVWPPEIPMWHGIVLQTLNHGNITKTSNTSSIHPSGITARLNLKLPSFRTTLEFARRWKKKDCKYLVYRMVSLLSL